MDLGEGGSWFLCLRCWLYGDQHLGLPGIKRFCGTQKHQLEHVKSQATEQSGHPSWLTPQPPPTSWVGWRVIGFAPTSLHRDSFRQGHNLCRFDVCEVKYFCLIVWIIEVLLFSIVLCSYTINQNCNSQPLLQGGKDAADTWRKTDWENRGTGILMITGPSLANTI